MFKIKDIIYSEAGKLLVGHNRVGYAMSGQETDFTEVDIPLDDMVIYDGVVTYGGGLVRQIIHSDAMTYAALKAEMVKRRYSLDDQIAVMLNKDDDAESALAYEKMQEWREWSGRVAKAIIETLNNKSEGE